jgi:hypothetical protein
MAGSVAIQPSGRRDPSTGNSIEMMCASELGATGPVHPSPLTSVILSARGLQGILTRMPDLAKNPSRKPITAQNMDEAKAAAYANDPQTELVILGLSENAAVTTCGWARHFFDSGDSSGF